MGHTKSVCSWTETGGYGSIGVSCVDKKKRSQVVGNCARPCLKHIQKVVAQETHPVDEFVFIVREQEFRVYGWKHSLHRLMGKRKKKAQVSVESTLHLNERPVMYTLKG